jgi:hypothetical protein
MDFTDLVREVEKGGMNRPGEGSLGGLLYDVLDLSAATGWICENIRRGIVRTGPNRPVIDQNTLETGLGGVLTTLAMIMADIKDVNVGGIIQQAVRKVQTRDSTYCYRKQEEKDEEKETLADAAKEWRVQRDDETDLVFTGKLLGTVPSSSCGDDVAVYSIYRTPENRLVLAKARGQFYEGELQLHSYFEAKVVFPRRRNEQEHEFHPVDEIHHFFGMDGHAKRLYDACGISYALEVK